MSEKKRVRDILLIIEAAKELNIPEELLKLTKDGIILVNYPMIMLGDSRKELNIREKENIKHLINDLIRDISFIVHPATPFKDKQQRNFSINHNMVSAFFNMVELKNYYPQLEIFMPEGIVDITPGILLPYSKKLSNFTFLGKKYIPPTRDALADQIGITFTISPPNSRKNYIHTNIIKIR